MANYQEQELSLLTCILAIMQKEELSYSRNRLAAENDRRQNEDQIWQRVSGKLELKGGGGAYGFGRWIYFRAAGELSEPA
jgi:hypothetical protein